MHNKTAFDRNLRGTGGQRNLRTLPCSKQCFQDIAKKFYIHHSINRVVSRANISQFSAVKLEMARHDGHELLAHGMAMTTQWVSHDLIFFVYPETFVNSIETQGETNVEIALATSQDSRHMKSIALVTMIFLPGTFFASMFSMGFFEWESDDGTVSVFQSFWVYVVLAAGFTALTVGAWWKTTLESEAIERFTTPDREGFEAQSDQKDTSSIAPKQKLARYNLEMS
ncbi:hypothetical protein FAGAP_5708 [Fusarium agapanthi]|uniref:Uncharacterized protein n=1 Tax=Fusarium agapanthi TaxID=1803897 RepID=A0A9P5BAD8_9HYPO|nr:hypothetical protein FAGAP_5708 [Fusarium agapanthi]